MAQAHASTAPSAGFLPTVTYPALLHGPSQIYFQANVITGLLILVGFLVASWQLAVLVVIGLVVNTVAGYFLHVGADNVRLGMQGYNGALIGAAVYAANGSQGWSYVLAALGGFACAPVMWFFVKLFASKPLARFGLPATTAPFCTVAGILYVLTTDIHTNATPQHYTDGTGESFLRSLLTNVAEVVLVGSIWSGALILLGLFIANWQVGLAAVMGSAVGSLVALAMGESNATVGEGLANYAGVLTAIALAVTFYKGNVASWLYAALGAAVTAVVTLLMTNATTEPHYTWPYILTTWLFLVIGTFIPALKRP